MADKVAAKQAKMKMVRTRDGRFYITQQRQEDVFVFNRFHCVCATITAHWTHRDRVLLNLNANLFATEQEAKVAMAVIRLCGGRA